MKLRWTDALPLPFVYEDFRIVSTNPATQEQVTEAIESAISSQTRHASPIFNPQERYCNVD